MEGSPKSWPEVEARTPGRGNHGQLVVRATGGWSGWQPVCWWEVEASECSGGQKGPSPAFGQPEGLLGEEVGAAGDQTPGPCRGREGRAHALRQVKHLPRWEPRTADLA